MNICICSQGGHQTFLCNCGCHSSEMETNEWPLEFTIQGGQMKNCWAFQQQWCQGGDFFDLFHLFPFNFVWPESFLLVVGKNDLHSLPLGGLAPFPLSDAFYSTFRASRPPPVLDNPGLDIPGWLRMHRARSCIRLGGNISIVQKKTSDEEKVTKLMFNKFVDRSATCKNWHCIFLLNVVQIAKWSEEGLMQIPFWSIRTWQNFGERCRFHTYALFPSQSHFLNPHLKVQRKWRVAEKFHFISSGSLTKCQFQMFILVEIKLLLSTSIYHPRIVIFIERKLFLKENWLSAVALPWEIYLHKIVCNFFLLNHFQSPFRNTSLN